MPRVPLKMIQTKLFYNIPTAMKSIYKSYLRVGLILNKPINHSCSLSLLKNVISLQLYSQRLIHSSLSPNSSKFLGPNSQLTGDIPKRLQHEDASNQEDKIDKLQCIPPKKNVLAPPSDWEEVDFVAPPLKPTFNIAAYADKSEILRHFIHIGVQIAKWEKHRDICFHILRLDLEKNIKPYIFFVNELGISIDNLGKWFTMNPFIFQESLTNLQVRVNYLKSKKFSENEIAKIILRTPKWLNYSVEMIDQELGRFQLKFSLTNAEVRHLAIADPKLILYSIQKRFYLERQIKCIDGQMGFSMQEQKQLLLEHPRIYRTTKDHLIARFNVVHNEIGLSHEAILQSPSILLLRASKLSERNKFLKFIGRNQYNPTKPNYISPKNFIEGSDAEFCQKVNSNIEMFNDFLKTL